MWMKPILATARYDPAAYSLMPLVAKTFTPAQCESMSQEPVMCKLITFNASRAATLPPPAGCRWMFPRWFSSPDLEGKLGRLYLWRCVKHSFKCVLERKLTWTMAALQDDVINGSVTSHWWTSDCFKHDLGWQTQWEEAVGWISTLVVLEWLYFLQVSSVFRVISIES